MGPLATPVSDRWAPIKLVSGADSLTLAKRANDGPDGNICHTHAGGTYPATFHPGTPADYPIPGAGTLSVVLASDHQ